MNADKHFETDELLDIVNENDHVIGQKNRSEVYAIGSSNFRAINAFIMNNEGLLWIPRRSPQKKLFPRCLDASVGGHVKAGETYQQAFDRELLEELNLDSSQVKYTFLASLNPYKNNVSAFMQLFVIKYEKTPDYNIEDFESSQWLSIAELKRIIKQGDPTKDDLPALIDLIEKMYAK